VISAYPLCCEYGVSKKRHQGTPILFVRRETYKNAYYLRAQQLVLYVRCLPEYGLDGRYSLFVCACKKLYVFCGLRNFGNQIFCDDVFSRSGSVDLIYDRLRSGYFTRFGIDRGRGGLPICISSLYLPL